MNDDAYQEYVKAAISLATLTDVQDMIANTSYPADRTPRADAARVRHRAEALAEFRAAWKRLNAA